MRTERIISSIPKDIEDECPRAKNTASCSQFKNTESECPITHSEPSTSENWVYPSPKMFWDAMNRKGTLPSHLSNPDSPKTQEELDWIVTIHNVVNEQCWQEICKWERFRVEGCNGSRTGDRDNAKNQNNSQDSAPQTSTTQFCTPVLQRFLGRPDDLSPRAWFKSMIIGYRRPFDRHDWYIRTRDLKNDDADADPPRRYIIDFYAGNRPGNTDSFYLDVRPAADTFDAIKLRMSKYFCEKITEIKCVFNK